MAQIVPVQCFLARTVLGWSARKLANVARVSAHTVANFERGAVLKASTVRDAVGLKCLIGDEARVDAAEGIGKSLQQGLQSAHDLGEVLQRATAAQLARVMDDDLDAKDAFAFAIDLQSQAATMQLEDRQIIGRSLDRDFPLCCALFSRTIFWTALASKDCLDSLQVQPRAATVKSQAS
jgi:hypothetical protein